jgi:hypothetical protein
MVDECVQREAVRVGVKYGLPSGLTCFVAQNREAATTVKKLDMDIVTSHLLYNLTPI